MRECFAVPTAPTVFGVRRDSSRSLQHQKVAKKSSQHRECSLSGAGSNATAFLRNNRPLRA